jgi:beta-glucanase (GH16 family)
MGVRTTASLALLLLLAAGCVSVRQPATPAVSLIWNDDFGGDRLDLSKWSYRGLGQRKLGVVAADAVSLDGQGHLVITASKVGDRYQTGMIGTQGKFEHKFGYWECRMKFQKQPGLHAAFWLQSPKLGQVIDDTRQSGTEIDIIERPTKHRNTAFHFLHWNGYGDQHKKLGIGKVIPGLDDGFHVFGLEWTPEEYIFYVDGVETWRTREAISHIDEYLILSLEIGEWGGDITKADLPDRIEVDYVRVYAQRPVAR